MVRLYPSCTAFDALRECHHPRPIVVIAAAWRCTLPGTYRDGCKHAVESVSVAVKSVLKMPSLPPQLPSKCARDETFPKGLAWYTFYGNSSICSSTLVLMRQSAPVRIPFQSDYRGSANDPPSVEIMRIEWSRNGRRIQGAPLRWNRR
jgi:hypothetical protein